LVHHVSTRFNSSWRDFSGEKRILEYKYSIYLKVNRGYKYGNFSYN